MNAPNVIFFFPLKILCLAQQSSSEESIAFETITYFRFYLQIITQDGIFPNNIGKRILFENIFY